MKIKKIGKLAIALGLVCAMSIGLSACGNSDDEKAETTEAIHVVSRENGSGTRDAFTEITKIIEKDSSGNKVDNTSNDAIVQNSTEAVMSTVGSDKSSIGYISLGSLNDSVKAIKIDGVEAKEENVKDGSYKLSRPFLLGYKGELNDKQKDFLNFILSKEGQEIVKNNGYVSVEDKGSYKSTNQKGDLTISGSTSVTPVMEKIVEAYKLLNPDMEIEIQSNGSSAGITDALNGAADIAMSSRELKDSEKLNKVEMARDGIAVIVNNDNKVDDLTMEKIKDIFTGKIKSWENL